MVADAPAKGEDSNGVTVRRGGGRRNGQPSYRPDHVFYGTQYYPFRSVILWFDGEGWDRKLISRHAWWQHASIELSRVYVRIPVYRLSSFVLLFLSGLHWHFSGLSELPLEQRLLLKLAGEHFPFFSFFLRRRALHSYFCISGGFFICTSCCRASTASTAQSVLHKAANQVRANQSARSKQTELARTSMSSVYAVFQKRTNELSSARPTKNVQPRTK